ncbi:MAG: helix-turn-helix domain-containing protein [Cyclobacteriaceae bacterium]|nr:helix-turn-helix domain-containing protein [Cyclobacteriaceae bacterium]
MSSNISLQKICEECAQPFIAKTLVTRFCSHLCNRRHNKKKATNQRLAISIAQEINISSPAETMKGIGNDYLKLPEAAAIMRVSRRTLFRLISEKKLKSKKVLGRTIILKEDIRAFFQIQ